MNSKSILFITSLLLAVTASQAKNFKIKGLNKDGNVEITEFTQTGHLVSKVVIPKKPTDSNHHPAPHHHDPQEDVLIPSDFSHIIGWNNFVAAR